MSFQFVELIGFAASALVFLTFCMQTLMPLRLIATASNILFMVYAGFAGLAPIFILHALLLPVNILRLVQQLQLRHRLRNTFSHPPEIELLMPFMTLEEFEPGTEIFHEGGAADRLYVVIEGAVTVDDIGITIGKGGVFGEIGLFSSEGCRTASVQAAGPVSAAWINRPTVIKIFEDHPDFALALTKLIASRLTDNQKNLRDKLGSHNG